MLSHIFVSWLVLHEAAWPLASTHVSQASHREFPEQTSLVLLLFRFLSFPVPADPPDGQGFPSERVVPQETPCHVGSLSGLPCLATALRCLGSGSPGLADRCELSFYCLPIHGWLRGL